MRPLSVLSACALVWATTACGGERPAPDEEAAETATDTAPAIRAPSDTPADPAPGDDVTLLQQIPNGGPMPDASRTGIPPYPGATVHTRFPRQRPGIVSFEAYTTDSWEEVQAYYDTTLGPDWRKIDAEDTKVYEKGDDEAAITLTEWNPEDLPSGVDHPAVLRNARTIIGAAWRTNAP